MKASHFFKSLLFTFVLIIFSQAALAQSWEYYNPIQVQELNLTEDQKQQLKEIEQKYSKQINELYKNTQPGEKSIESYKAIQEQVKLLRIQKDKERKTILTADQLSIFEGYILEKKADQKGRNLSQQKERLERDYTGIILTPQQNIALYDKIQLLNKENIAWKEKKNKKQEIYKEILTDEQYAIMVKIDQEKKAIKEEKLLSEIKKGLTVAEGLMPIAEEFTLPKMLVLRNKLEVKISEEDKRTLEELRALRKVSFDEMLNEGLEEMEEEINRIENPELRRYTGFTQDLVVDNADLISNAWTFGIFNTDEPSKQLNTLVEKYKKEFDDLEEQLLFVIKESVKKGAVVASAEYPVPPVAMWINEITLDNEIKRLFLLLDPANDFSFEVESFDIGEGKHLASVFPNPANKVQTLEFFNEQAGNVNIEIIDESGKVVQIISNENRMQGHQKLEVNVQSLNPQLYFYRISSKAGVTLLKFSVIK